MNSQLFGALWSSLLGATALSGVVFAQDGGAGDDQIVVTATPIRDSLAASIEAKRNADNVADIVSADTIGRFPDQNLADSLGRIPGLAIERDQGQARFINFRGAPFRYTQIAFDGVTVLGAEDGRIPRFDAFPSVITNAIESNKAITPDMPGDAVAGFINIKTFSPFDARGFRFSGEAGYGNQELGNVPINKYNLRASYSTDQLGFLVFGSHNLRGRITDNREFEYVIDDATGGLIPNELDFRSYRGEREDNAYGGKIAFRPNSTTEVFFSTLYSEFIDREERNQFVFDFAGGAEAVDFAAGPVTPDQGYQPLVLVTRLLQDGRYTNSTWTNTLGADFELAGWMAEARLSYIETDNQTFVPLPYSVAGTVAASYDVTDPLSPIVNLFAPFTTETPTDVNTIDYALTFGVVFGGGLETQALQAKFDAEREMEIAGMASTIKVGAQAEQREASGGDALVFGGFPGEVNINDFVTGKLWTADFDNTIGGRTFDNPALFDAWAEATGGVGGSFDDDSIIALEEDLYAAYAMATTPFSWGNIVYGARVELTDFATTGNLVTDAGLETIAASDTYVNVLPSAHVNVDVSDDVKARFSVTTGVSRPTYSELRASQTASVEDQDISGGNPNLDAETSVGLDAAIEWYFADASLFSAGVFYRAIDNVIYPGTIAVDGNAFYPDIFDTPGDVPFNSYYNGEDGQLTGLELSFVGQATFLPGALDGFGASGNITFLDSEFTAPEGVGAGTTFALPGTSDLIYNASVYYENFGLSARVNYQYRDAWLSTTENDSLTEFWGETKRLDASIRYTLPVEYAGVGVTLFANGNNLTDETDVRYVNTARTPNQYEGFGQRYLFGVRIDY